MTLGNRIKLLRQNLSLSQPELASIVGIEQSYLSKLENDKCIPSNDIFRSLLDSFSMNIDKFMVSIDIVSERNRLTQIPDIEQWLQLNRKRSLNSIKRYLLACCVFIALGSGLLYSGLSQIFFNDVHFEYKSYGVLKKEEPNDYFRNWRDSLPMGDFENIEELRLEIEKRKSNELKLLDTNKGSSFVIEVDDGKRLFTFSREVEIPQLINALLQFLGIFLLVGGIMGLIVEGRISKSITV